jgi:hypothetical protein
VFYPIARWFADKPKEEAPAVRPYIFTRFRKPALVFKNW